MARTFRTIEQVVETATGKLTDVVNAATNAIDDLARARGAIDDLVFEGVIRGRAVPADKLDALAALAKRFEQEADDMLVALNRELV